MQGQRHIEVLERDLSSGQYAVPIEARKPFQLFVGFLSGALTFLVLVVVWAILLEAVFRIAHIGEGEAIEPHPTLGCAHIPNKLVTWRLEGYSRESLNSHGMRDVEHSIAKPPGVKRIAILGDSATEGLQVSMNETFAKQLENQLNAGAKASHNSDRFEVLNFGCASYSTGQELLLYKQEVRQFQPDQVIVLYNAGDSAENIFVPQSADRIIPRPYFHLENDPGGGVEPKLVKDDSVLQLYADVLNSNSIMDKIRRESHIFGVFSQQNLMLSINEPLYGKIKRLISRVPIPYTTCKSTAVLRPSYALPDAMLVTSKLFGQLNSEVQKDGAQLVVATFPNVHRDPSYQKEEDVLKETGRREHFEVLSLTKPFIDSADSSKLFLQYHFSKFGHSLVANQLSSYVQRQQ